MPDRGEPTAARPRADAPADPAAPADPGMPAGPGAPAARPLWGMRSGNGRLRADLETAADGAVVGRVAGELDHDSAPELRRALTAALHSGPVGLLLDLSGVTFCDSAGLEVLLRIRREAAAAGRTFGLGTVGERVGRLLDLTETRSLLVADGADAPLRAPGGPPGPARRTAPPGR
ncbi:STAS domain-containing protein [Kitasatospora sp. NPDC054939]